MSGVNALECQYRLQLTKNGCRGQDLFFKVNIHEVVGHIEKE